MRSLRAWRNFALTAGCAIAALCLQVLLLSEGFPHRFHAFPLLLAVAVSAYLGGIRHGLLATGIVTIGDSPWLAHPTDSGAHWIFEAAGLLAMGTTLSVLLESLHRAKHARELALDALQQAEERYRNFISGSTEGIWRLEFDPPVPTDLPEDLQIEQALRCGKLAEANDAMARIYGHESAATLLGACLEQLIMASDIGNLRMMRDCIRCGYRLSGVETRELDRQGNIRLSLNSLTGVVEEGCLVRMWGTKQDITQQRQAQETLRANEEFLRISSKAAGIGQWSWDIARDHLELTDLCAAMLGMDRAVPNGSQSLMARVHAMDRARVDRCVKRSVLDGEEFDCEFRVTRGDGTLRWVRVRGKAETDEDGNPTTFSGVAIDIDDYKRLECDLRRAKELAESASREKDRFLAVLSHELRTPLTPVLTTVQTVEDDQRLPPDLREVLSMVRRNVELEARLIDDLLDLTRIARGSLVLSRQVSDIHVKLANVVQICDGERRGKQIELELEFAAGECCVHGDPARLQQVFWNLLKNAIKFTPPGGKVSLRTSNPAPRRLRIEVSDTGIGIETQVLQTIFRAFDQGCDDVGRKYGGLGLGLAISRALVELHHGTIEAHSPGRGCGSRFIVEFETAPAPAQVEVARPAGGAALPPLSILLVEDHEDTARAVARLLRSCGCQVRMADTVAGAVQVANAEDFDLLISDIGLPDGSGLDLMRQLLARKPVTGICMSGFGMEEDVRQSREAGFVEHLTKPVSVTQLKKAILKVAARDDADDVQAVESR